MQRRGRGAFALAATALALTVPAAALGGNGNGNGPKGDVVHLGDIKVKKPKKQDLPAAVPAESAAAVAAAAAEESPPIGTVKIWPTINILTGGVSLSTFTLQGVGDKIEIWVANNLTFPAGDCRNDGVRNVITPAQVCYFVDQFDGNIEPKMSSAFSSPPSRDGTGALLEQLAPSLFPKGYFKGPGSKIVTLIANFRDENYSDITFPSYVAGYHSSDINAYVNRNVMSIDSYDWAHRTGANPPNEPSTVLCQNRPAQPFKYEGVFAHEYQHLLESGRVPGSQRGPTRVSPTTPSPSPAMASRPARSSRPATTVTSRRSSAGVCCRRRRTRSRNRTAVPRTRSRSGTTRVASRPSLTTAPSTRSWNSSPAGTAKPS